MIGLFDRDVFFKLCCCNLWLEAMTALGITQPYRLQSTSSARANVRKISKMLGDADPTDAIARATEVVAQVPVLPDEFVEGLVASEGFSALADISGIDEGEQILGAILLNDRDGKILISGDKRFVQALKVERRSFWEKMEGAVISFEMCLLAIEREYGFDYLLARVDPVKHCDNTLRLAIGHTPTKQSFCDALASWDPCRETPEIA
ncbi:hypothetical protein ACC699_24335 [Rhizobium ruizarguesonis]